VKLLHCLLVRQQVKPSQIDLEYVPLQVRGLLLELADELDHAREPIVPLHDVHEEILIDQNGCGVAFLYTILINILIVFEEFGNTLD
jgi:hypothetical protein